MDHCSHRMCSCNSYFTDARRDFRGKSLLLIVDVILGLAILFGRSRGDGTINVAFSVLFSGFIHTKSNLCRYLALSYPGTAIVAPYFLIGTQQKAEKESAREEDVFVSR